MNKQARLSLTAATVVAGVFALWGGWARRWISDDGLIVLRTVRNLLAGNGPVFNAGERVEANTSTLWQYMIYAVAWVTGGRLEDISTALALTLTVIGCALATYTSGVYWQRTMRRSATVIPFGIIAYLALPPARDFATSGLEWGLSLFWLACWWTLMVDWATPARRAKPSAGYLLAFWCGLSWLVRPELALYGGAAGIMLIVASPRKTPGILAAALPVPLAYEIFRMGYYGLLTPQTAVAKSAADSNWASGWRYLCDLFGAHWVYVPAAIAAVVGVWLFYRGYERGGTRGRRLAIALVCVACGIVHVLYVLRVGGDFMHGRMLLLPLFALLLPVMAVPLSRAAAVAGAGVVAWAAVAIARPPTVDESTYRLPDGTLGIVDERDFWTRAVGREPGNPPKYAEDFLPMPMLTDWTSTLDGAIDNGDAQIVIARLSRDPETYSWYARPRFSGDSDLQNLGVTSYWINLGMTGMYAPLDVRILDTVGLADPLAARMPRDPSGRVGHDKYLPDEWQSADAAVDLNSLPPWLDKKMAMQARAALRTPELNEFVRTYREPMSWERFRENVRFALGKGRTLTVSSDPSVYLDETTKRLIENGADLGRKGTQVAWPAPQQHDETSEK